MAHAMGYLLSLYELGFGTPTESQIFCRSTKLDLPKVREQTIPKKAS